MEVTSVDQERISKEMHELEGIIGYTFRNVSLLADAMRSVLLERRERDGKSNREYANDATACFGDTIVKCLIAKHLFLQGKRKGEITVEKAELESNEVLHTVTAEYHVSDYAYNEDYFAKDDPPQHKRVRSESHDPYVEAITAAIFLDGGWEAVDAWFREWLLPRLEQHKPS